MIQDFKAGTCLATNCLPRCCLAYNKDQTCICKPYQVHKLFPTT